MDSDLLIEITFYRVCLELLGILVLRGRTVKQDYQGVKVHQVPQETEERGGCLAREDLWGLRVSRVQGAYLEHLDLMDYL